MDTRDRKLMYFRTCNRARRYGDNTRRPSVGIQSERSQQWYHIFSFSTISPQVKQILQHCDLQLSDLICTAERWQTTDWILLILLYLSAYYCGLLDYSIVWKYRFNSLVFFEALVLSGAQTSWNDSFFFFAKEKTKSRI